MGADPRAGLLAWCDETERVAREATPGPWRAESSPFYIVTPESKRAVCTDQFMRWEDRRHICRHGPPSVLAQAAALRAVVRQHRQDELNRSLCVVCRAGDGSWPCTTLLELADGFTPGWRTP